MNRLTIVAFCAGVAASFIGGTLGLWAADSMTADRTEPIFVYGTLDNPLLRAYGCECFAAETKARLPGFAYGLETLIESPNSTVRGSLILISTEEMYRIDEYIGVPETHHRAVVTVNDKPAWVYVKRRGNK